MALDKADTNELFVTPKQLTDEFGISFEKEMGTNGCGKTGPILDKGASYAYAIDGSLCSDFFLKSLRLNSNVCTQIVWFK